jgi:hypothetical protein
MDSSSEIWNNHLRNPSLSRVVGMFLILNEMQIFLNVFTRYLDVCLEIIEAMVH